MNENPDFNGGVDLDRVYSWDDLPWTRVGHPSAVPSRLKHQHHVRSRSWDIEIGRSLSVDLDYVHPDTSVYSLWFLDDHAAGRRPRARTGQ